MVARGIEVVFLHIAADGRDRPVLGAVVGDHDLIGEIHLLAQDAECRAFLLTLTAAQDELKELRSKLGADMTTGEVY